MHTRTIPMLSRFPLGRSLALPLALALAACSGDDPTRPQLDESTLAAATEAYSFSGADLETPDFAGDEIDRTDVEYDGEAGPIEHVMRAANGVELVFRFNGQVRAREEAAITLRVRSGGRAIRGLVTVDFGDGRRLQKFEVDRTAGLVHTYRAPGSYRVFAVVEAEDGQRARGGFRLRIADQLRLELDVEVVSAGGPGEETELRFIASEVDGSRARAGFEGDLTVDYGDGTSEVVEGFTGEATRTHTYQEEGDFDIGLALAAVGREFEGRETISVTDAPPTGDEFDLSQATIMGNSDRGIASWAVTSTVTGVRISGSEICIDHTKAGQWPIWSGGPVEGNPWVVANIGGQWFAGTYEWLRPGQTCKGITAGNIGQHLKWPPMDGWAPRSGEVVYFFVSTPARLGATTINERSNLVRVEWP